MVPPKMTMFPILTPLNLGNRPRHAAVVSHTHTLVANLLVSKIARALVNFLTCAPSNGPECFDRRLSPIRSLSRNCLP